MSTPAANKNPWHAPGGQPLPQGGPAARFYRRPVQPQHAVLPTSTDQQARVQDPHWYPQQTSAMEQQGGNDPWSWGTSSHNHFSSEPVPSPAPTNCDPWNWGWDESNNNKTMSDKNTDPAWDWPAEDTTLVTNTTYHTETHDFVPMYGYTDNTSAPQGYTPVLGQVSQHGYIGQPGSYVFQQPQHYDHIEAVNKSTKYDSQAITHQGAVETAGNRTNHDSRYVSQAIPHQGAVEIAGSRTNHNFRYDSQAITHQGAVETAGNRTNHDSRYVSQPITHKGAVETAGNRTNHDSRYVSQAIPHQGAVEIAGIRTNHDSRYDSQAITHQGAVETAGSRTNHDSSYDSQAITHQGAVETAGSKTNHDSRYESQAITHQGAVETAGNRTNHDSRYVSQAITHQGAVETAGNRTNHDSRYECQAITHQGAVETAGNRTNHDSRYECQAITHQSAVETAGSRTDHDSRYESQAITHQGAVETAGNRTNHDSRYESQAITHQGAVETAGSRTNHDTTQTDDGRLDVIKPEVQTYSPLSYESQGNVTYDTDLHVRYTSLEQAIDAAECEGEPAPPGSTIDLQEGLIVSRGPEGLPSQWSTESLPSQGSDGNQSDVSQQQDSRAYQYGAYEYHPDQTVGPPQLVYSPELSAMKQDTHRHPPLKANPSSETVFHNNSSFAVDAEQYKVEDKNPLERSSIQHYQEHGPQDSSGHWYPRHWTHDQGISDQEYQIRGHSTQGTSVMHRPISHPQEIGPHQYTPQDQGPQETSVQQHSSNHQELEVRPQQYMPQGQGPLETSVQQHSSNHQELEVRPQQYMPQGQGPLETSAQQHPLSHPCQELEMRHEELTPKGQGSQETGGHHFPSSDQDPNIRSRQRQGLQEASDMGAIFLQSDLGEPQFETRVNRQEAMSHSRGTKMGYVENEEIVPPEKANVVVVSQSHSPEDINTLTDEGNTNTTTHLGEVSTPQGVCLGLTPAADVNPIVPSPSSDVKQGPPPPGDVRQGTSPTGETTNPYKLGLSSHKHTNRFFHSPAQFLDPGVNLETVPDNKEHPDCVEHSAVERRNTSPLVRHTEPVGQDATVPLLHWPQQTPSYSASPENMEVAPRCGPDRNQYLETGQLTEEEPPSFQRLVAGGAEDTKRDEVLPPPGLRRMVPGESSSPESSANVFQPIEPRVVTGVDTQPAPSPVQVPRIKSECSSPVPETTKALPQPPSERSETIGSDNVDLFQPTSAAIADNHRENIGRREEPEERDVVVPTRRRGDYYNPREHEGDDSPGRENRGQYEVVGDLRGSPQSSGRYRDDPRRDVRRSTRSKRSYNRVDDEDEDTEEYYSDRDRVGRRDKPAYRDDYDHRYKGRAERNREKPQHRGHDKLSPRDRQERVPARDRDRRRDPRQDYYSREYEDNPYYREQRSRPSSRSRPEYDDYRVRDYHAYSGYNYYGRQIQGYPYSAYYGYDLKYLEDLRRTNPVLYAEYYAKYLSPQAVAQGSYTEDRGSVHSGRSSANEERGLDHTNSSGAGEPGSSTPQQLTPAKFSTAHVKGVMTARGQLLRVMPHYPLDGQSATVEIHDMQALPGLEDTRQELRDFPGPLVRASSSKNYLINFCTRKIKSAEKDPGLFDRGSVILLWRLLVVLLKQNGSIVGQDIAELLLSERSESKTSSHGSHDAEETITNTATGPIKSEEELTGHFRELLLYGNTKEALEWAMSQGLWGHALFLASKMDARTHANVMMRFANGLTMNDPLQTLYQLMSGRQPAAVTCCADEKWGDWRPHLAMILSNCSQRPDLLRRAVIILGDTLGARGCLHAAHFCYLMAQHEFGTYAHKSSKIVLIGSSHLKPFNEFATNEAIQMTEIYLYASRLGDENFNLPQFQPYKLLYAQRLSEHGFTSEAAHYSEELAGTILKHPGQYPATFLRQVYDLGDRLRYHDPLYSSAENQRDPQWLTALEAVITDYQAGVLRSDNPDHGSTSNLSYSPATTHEPPPPQETSQYTETPYTDWQTQGNNDFYNRQQHHNNTEVAWYGQESQFTPEQSQFTPEQSQFTPEQSQFTPEQSQFTPEQSQFTPEQSQFTPEQLQFTPEQSQFTPDQSQFTPEQSSQYSWRQDPQTSTPLTDWSQSGLSHQTPADDIEEHKPVSLSTSAPSQAKPKKESQRSKPSTAASNGWFGGLWNKIALRPKNQMKLPDDKNPSIVWDSDNKRWTNLDNDQEEEAGAPPPPPKMSELPRPTVAMAPVRGVEPQVDSSVLPSSNNIYKMNKTRSLRASYVDVLGGSKAANPLVSAPDLFPTMVAPRSNINLFVPAPVERSDEASSDFLTPASGGGESQDSASDPSQGTAFPEPQPFMFDPSSFNQTTSSWAPSNQPHLT